MKHEPECVSVCVIHLIRGIRVTVLTDVWRFSRGELICGPRTTIYTFLWVCNLLCIRDLMTAVTMIPHWAHFLNLVLWGFGFLQYLLSVTWQMESLVTDLTVLPCLTSSDGALGTCEDPPIHFPHPLSLHTEIKRSRTEKICGLWFRIVVTFSYEVLQPSPPVSYCLARCISMVVWN